VNYLLIRLICVLEFDLPFSIDWRNHYSHHPRKRAFIVYRLVRHLEIRVDLQRRRPTAVVIKYIFFSFILRDA
jgi:hypothetical protein